jgi:hypothetical protein
LTDLCTVSHVTAGWWVTTYVTVDDCAGSTYTKCQGSFSAVSSSSSSTAAMTGFSFAGLAILGLLYARKRRVARIDLNREEQLLQDGQQHALGHFELMRDRGVQV